MKLQAEILRPLLLCAALMPVLASGCLREKTRSDVLYQTATISSLMQGVYDSPATWKDCRNHGDTGLGTFNGLDGEMVVIDGRCYRVGIDGSVSEMPDSAHTPFITLAFFEPDISVNVPAGLELAGLKAFLDQTIPSDNYPWTLRIDGVFAKVKTRSVPKQEKPYPPLTEAVKKQSVFDFENLRGSVVGFRLPDYTGGGLNVPGWHLHFISDDRTHGGHLLGISTGPDCRAGLDKGSGIYAIFPDSPEFAAFSATGDRHGALEKVEQGK